VGCHDEDAKSVDRVKQKNLIRIELAPIYALSLLHANEGGALGKPATERGDRR
jgi:hypothetical protein